MEWEVEFHDAFDEEFDGLSQPVQDSIFARVKLLAMVGPDLKRPYADTLNGSRHANMKELRCKADDGVWRIAIAFDPERKAISCWRRETRQVSTKSASTGSWRPRQMSASIGISRRRKGESDGQIPERKT